VTGTTTALTSTTSLSTSPMPKNSMNSGIQARVGTCARATKVGSTSVCARREAQPGAQQQATADARQQAPQQALQAYPQVAPQLPEPNPALCQTSDGAGRICSLIQCSRLATTHNAASSTGTPKATRHAAGLAPRKGAQRPRKPPGLAQNSAHQAISQTVPCLFIYGIKNSQK
jgi:hypothetical protein